MLLASPVIAMAIAAGPNALPLQAVHLWYAAAAGEMPVEITLEEEDTKLDFAISRTEEEHQARGKRILYGSAACHSTTDM